MNFFWACVFLLLPLAGLSYVGWHVWVLLPFHALWRWAAVVLGLLCFFTIFLDFTGRLDAMPMSLARTLYNIGTSSVIVLLYLAMLFAMLDVGRLCSVVPRTWLHSNGWASLGVLVTMVSVFTYGYVHYRHKVRVPMDIKTAKPLARPYRMVMVSDMHLGYHNDRSELARWVDMMNAEKPDIVLIAGDIIDVSVRPLEEEDMAAEFRRLAAPVYACLGNHEYYSGCPRARQFYQDAGIRLLIDEVAEVDSALVIIGRDDRTNRHRKPLAELMKEAKRAGAASRPSTGEPERVFIVLDHQPYHLEEAERLGVDFQLSGHTHRGQVWPLSWITDRMYECSWGSHRRGSTQYYVSSGLGIWGGRYRIGTQSEYVVATLEPR